MIQQKHIGPIWPEEQAPVEERTKPTPPSSRRWGQVLLFGLGVAVSVLGGFILSLPIVDSTNMSIKIALLILLGGIGGALLRTWWALLIVSVACFVGVFLGLIAMSGFDLQGWWQSWAASGFEGLDIAPILVLLVVPPIGLGVAIGIPSGKKIEQRLHH